MKPDDIRELQAMLARLGLYPGAEDSVLGSRTRAAVDACLGRLPAVPAGAARWPASRRAACCRALLADAFARIAAAGPCDGAPGGAASRTGRSGGGQADGRGRMGALEGA
ncbi:MAG: peptidoglycan-binding domain-containing protein [Pseudomonadota bacterium]